MAAHSGATSFPSMGSNPVMMPPMNQMHAQPNVTGSVHFDAMGFAAKSSESKDDESNEVKLEKKKKLDAERKKKEEEEKVKQAAAKQQDKSRPVSSTPIAGTPWCVVWTGDGRVFFYNPSTRTSVWERPEDLVGRADVDKAVSATPDQITPATSTLTKEEKPKIAQAEANIENKPPTAKRSESESSDNDDVPNKKLKTADSTGNLANSYLKTY